MAEEITFASWLRRRRKELSITQEQLAERLDISWITLRKLETGERHPSGQIALLLADHLHVPYDERHAFVAFARTGRQTQGEASPVAPWRNTFVQQTNLPTLLAPIIGRDNEVAAVVDHLLNPKTRLLTLTGAGGIGKTRLALHASSGLVGHFDDGVYVVELAPISDTDLVLPAIAGVLGLREIGGQGLGELLLQHLRGRRMLLVLDNFEQVLDAAPAVVRLLEASPWVKVLVTSREPLHVRGERRFPVPPLAVPNLAQSGDLLILAINPSVELFVERAQSVRLDFTLTQENAVHMAHICVRLEGLPLAIELAAARVGSFSPEAMLSELALQFRLNLLAKGTRDMPVRQRTLRSTIAWSYNLLNSAEQKLFRRLAVFVGGCTAEAVEALYRSEENFVTDININDGLQSLKEKSLLNVSEATFEKRSLKKEPRFVMLETIHEYAREKLQESGEVQALERQHALYFMRLAEEADPHLNGPAQAEWFLRLDEEYDNLRAALLWARTAGEKEQDAPRGMSPVEVGLRIAGALGTFWTRAYIRQGREQFTVLLDIASRSEFGLPALAPTKYSEKAEPSEVRELRTKTIARAKALRWAGHLARILQELEAARSYHEEGLALARKVEDWRGIAFSLYSLAILVFRQGKYAQARALSSEALAVAREAGEKTEIAFALNWLGSVEMADGNLALARSLKEQALAIHQELGNKFGTEFVLNALGDVARMEGNYKAARSYYEASLEVSRELGYQLDAGTSLLNLGLLACQEGDNKQARTLFTESLRLFQTHGEKRAILVCLMGLGGLAASEGQAQKAARLLGAEMALREALGIVLEPPDQSEWERYMTIARARLDEATWQTLWNEGRALSIEQAVAYALEEDGP